VMLSATISAAATSSSLSCSTISASAPPRMPARSSVAVCRLGGPLGLLALAVRGMGPGCGVVGGVASPASERAWSSTDCTATAGGIKTAYTACLSAHSCWSNKCGACLTWRAACTGNLIQLQPALAPGDQTSNS
jgi:hypothetical protein